MVILKCGFEDRVEDRPGLEPSKDGELELRLLQKSEATKKYTVSETAQTTAKRKWT